MGLAQIPVFASVAMGLYLLPHYGLRFQQSGGVFVFAELDVLRPNSSIKEEYLFSGCCPRTWICLLS